MGNQFALFGYDHSDYSHFIDLCYCQNPSLFIYISSYTNQYFNSYIHQFEIVTEKLINKIFFIQNTL